MKKKEASGQFGGRVPDGAFVIPPLDLPLERPHWLSGGAGQKAQIKALIKRKRAEKKLWEESQHPRHPAGSDTGGEFAPAGGGAESATKEKAKKKAVIKGDVSEAADALGVVPDDIAEGFGLDSDEFHTEITASETRGEGSDPDESSIRASLAESFNETFDRQEELDRFIEKERESYDDTDAREYVEGPLRKDIAKNKELRDSVLKEAELDDSASDADKQKAIDEYVQRETEDQLNEYIDEEINRIVDDDFESHVDRMRDQYIEDNYNDEVDAWREANPSSVDQITIEGDVRTADNHRVASFTREIHPEDGYAYHASFFIDKEYQNKKIARDLLDRSVHMYDKIGLNEVKVFANGDVGKYAWAMYGFDFDDQYALENFRSALLARVAETDAYKKMTKEQQVQELAKVRAVKHSWDVAAYRVGGEKVGKDLMLHGTSWNGTLKLKGEGRKIFDAYTAASKRPPEDKSQLKLPFAQNDGMADQDSEAFHYDILGIEDEMHAIINRRDHAHAYEWNESEHPRDTEMDDAEGKKLLDEAIRELDGEHDHAHHYRAKTGPERRVDFAQAKQALDASESNVKERLTGQLKGVQDQLLAWVRVTPLNSDVVRQLAVATPADTQRTLQDMFEGAWGEGKDAGISEVPRAVRAQPRVQDVRTFALLKYDAGFEPEEAMTAFENRAWMIKDVIDANIQAQVRLELFEHLKGGRTLGDTIDRLREVFEPWVGDPEKVGSDDLLRAPRLENIVRTESTWAYNQGRLAVGDAAEDYVIGYQFSAIIDERTTETCQTADGLVLRKDDSRTIRLTPPLHFQCRSVLVFVTQDDQPVEWSDDREIDKALALVPKGFK